MLNLEKEISVLLEKREKMKFLADLQHQAEQAELIPPMPLLLLRKLSQPLQYAGGLMLGSILAIITLIFNFLFFIRLLHIEL